MAAIGAGVAFVDMAKAAYSDKLAADKLERSLKKVKGVTDDQAEAVADWVDQMELATLVADDDLRAALERLLPATENVTEAQNLAALAWDASVASGTSYESIVKAMAKGVEGNTTALKKMFPWLDAGPDKVLSMSEAMEQLNAKFGGEAKEAADSDLFGRLGKAFDQIKEAIGGISLPTLEEVATWFADEKHQEDIEGWIKKLGEWAKAVGEDLQGKLEDFITYLQSEEGKKAIADFAQNLRDIAAAFDAVATAIGGVIGWWDKLPDFLKGNPLTQFDDWLADHPFPLLKPPAKKEYGDDPDEWFPARNSSSKSGGSKPTVVVNQTFHYPKAEKASASSAAAIRAARYLTA